MVDLDSLDRELKGINDHIEQLISALDNLQLNILNIRSGLAKLYITKRKEEYNNGHSHTDTRTTGNG